MKKIDREIRITINGEFGKPNYKKDCKIYENGNEVDALPASSMQFTALCMMDFAIQMLNSVNNVLVESEMEDEQ